MDFSNLEELEKIVLQLKEKYGYIKVKLVNTKPGLYDECIWAVLFSDEDKQIYDSSSKDEIFYIRLANHPFDWHNRYWGSKIAARTNGNLQPNAYIEDNKTPELLEELEFLSQLYESQK